MRQFVGIMLLVGFLPIEILSNPAPISLTTLLVPLALLFTGLLRSSWAFGAVLRAPLKIAPPPTLRYG